MLEKARATTRISTDASWVRVQNIDAIASIFCTSCAVVSLESEHVLHVVEAGGLVLEPEGGAHGTGGEGEA